MGNTLKKYEFIDGDYYDIKIDTWYNYIENPPKTGTMIIGYNFDGTMEIVFNDGIFSFGFTHWRKLPEPPKELDKRINDIITF